jgi:hypothetical protein
MAEGEIAVSESLEQAPQKITLIEEVRAKALKKEAQGEEIKDQKARENIAKNAQNFWRFFNQIPAKNYPRLDTPEKLIEALNKAGGNFVNEGDKFSVNNSFYQVFEVHPLSVASDEILDLCDEKRYSPMWGTNFWDNPPKEGRLFIPAVYLVKKLA